MKGTSIIVKKELNRVFSDRKLIFSLFILPAVLVIAIYSLMGTMIGSMNKDIETHISKVTVVNASDKFKGIVKETGYAEGAEINYINQAEYDADKEQLRQQIYDGEADLLVVFEDGLEAKVAANTDGKAVLPNVDIAYNSTKDYSGYAYQTFGSGVIGAYRDALLAERIGGLQVLSIFMENDEVIADEAQVNSQFASMMLPYLITILLFAGVMSVGVDAIAGEKERGTLASMLLTPVKRSSIVSGKLISITILSGLSALVYAGSMIIAFSFMGDTIGADAAEMGFGGVSFGALQVVELILIMISLSYLYVAVTGLLAVLAKDTKTATSYISPVYFIVVLLGLVTMFTMNSDSGSVMYLIPVYGSAISIRDICSNSLEPMNFLCSIISPAVVASVVTFAMAKLFDNEKVMFNA